MISGCFCARFGFQEYCSFARYRYPGTSRCRFEIRNSFASLSLNIISHDLAPTCITIPEPFWYFIPVTLIGLIPWTVCVVASVAESARVWWARTTTNARVGRRSQRIPDDLAGRSGGFLFSLEIKTARLYCAGIARRHAVAGRIFAASSIGERKSGYFSNCFALDCRCDADCPGPDDSVHHPSASSSLGKGGRNFVLHLPEYWRSALLSRYIRSSALPDCVSSLWCRWCYQ